MFLFALFGWVVCLFLLFFLTHFTNSNYALSCCGRIFSAKSSPFRAVCCSFCLLHCLFCFGVYWLRSVFLVLSSCSLLLIFFAILMLFSPLLGFDHLFARDAFAYFFIFLIVSCVFVFWAVCTCMGGYLDTR